MAPSTGQPARSCSPSAARWEDARQEARSPRRDTGSRHDTDRGIVSHAVGPVYIDGRHGEESLLRSCYSTALSIAEGMGLESIAFPIISGGVYGYPRRDAIRIALEELGKTPMRATLCCYLEDEYRTAGDILAGMRP